MLKKKEKKYPHNSIREKQVLFMIPNGEGCK